jgi:FAS-associated factor 2
VQQRHAAVLSEFHVRRLYQQQESELRRQQDEEYQATLRADQERERQQREAQESARSEQQAKEQQLRDAQDLVQPEPAPGTPGTTMVRFVLPAGKKINRRFVSAHTTIRALKAFVRLHCHENQVEMGTIGLSTSFPRVTYNETEDEPLTLEEAGLVPQAVLMVQDLDA